MKCSVGMQTGYNYGVTVFEHLAKTSSLEGATYDPTKSISH